MKKNRLTKVRPRFSLTAIQCKIHVVHERVGLVWAGHVREIDN